MFGSDVLEIRNMENNERVLMFDPPTQDCFHIREVAISLDGTRAGFTGDAIVYGEYDPASWVHEKAGFIGPASEQHLVVEIGEATYSHPMTRGIALGDRAWFLDNYCIPISAADEPVDLETTYKERRYGPHLTRIVAVDGGGFAAIGGPFVSRRPMLNYDVILGHPDEPAETDTVLSFESSIEDIAVIDGAILIGHADGRVVRIGRPS